MIKTAIKLLITVAILNAVVRCGIVSWHYYEFKDATHQLITFGGGEPTGTLHERILEKAAEMQLPVLPENVDVSRELNKTTASVKYSQPVEVFPRYIYPVDFDFTISAVAVRPTTANDVR
jgi:hypothetical protein